MSYSIYIYMYSRTLEASNVSSDTLSIYLLLQQNIVFFQSLDICIQTARTTDITVSGYIQSNSKNY
jgi:hypothetical protein